MNVGKRIPEFNWDDARFFLAAFRAGSLLGAARDLGVSHSTVKRRLEGLERSLGARLFTPTGEGLLPTDAAQAALDMAEQVEQATTRFRDRLVGESREVSGALIVTAVDGMAGMLAPVIKGYTERYPKVALKLNTNNRVLDLRRREVDVAVRVTNHPDEDLFGRRVGAVEYRPFASEALVKSCGRKLIKFPWILWDQAVGATGTESWFQEHMIGREPLVRVTHTTSMLALAQAGVGAAVLPEPVGRAAGLSPIGKRIQKFRTGIWCLCHQDLRHSERVRGFMEEAAKRLAL